MAIIIGIVGMVVGVTGIIIGWVALTKVQTLSVAFVKAHIQGLRTESAKNTATINLLINRLAILENNNNKAENTQEDETTTQVSTH